MPNRSRRSSGRPDERTVVDRIRAVLLTDQFPPGSRISPEDFADDLGVSHIPIREALRVLESEGLVTRVVNRGFFVPSKSLADVEDIYLWRQVVEDKAQEIAIPRMTDAALDRLERLCARTADARETGDLAAGRDLNRQFHFAVFEGCGSPRIVRFIETLWDSAARYYLPHMSDLTRSASVRAHHVELVQACRERDIGWANRVMNEHRMLTLESVRKAFADDDTRMVDEAGG